MKRILLFSTALFLNAMHAQVDLDFNSDALPAEWTSEGSFETSNAEIHPVCQENALLGSFFTPDTEFWIETGTYDYEGNDVAINMTFGLKDLYHSLGVNTSFQKPYLYIQYAEGDSEEWTGYAEVPIEELESSASCLQANIIISADDLQGFQAIKYRLTYVSPPQTSALYLLYWAIDKLSINELVPTLFPCTENLGGGLEPAFVTLKINGTTFDHNTYSEPTSYYHQYPKSGNTTATLEAGQAYDLFTFTSSEAVVGIWMDYNQNDTFEESEYTLLVDNLNAQNTTPFTVPATSNTGAILMRIRTRAYGSAVNAENACTSFGSGETRDYVVTVSNNLGNDTFNPLSNLKIYPNPASDKVTVETLSGIQKIAVYNMLGQLVSVSNSKTIDVSHLNTGTYIADITSEDGTRNSRKFIKK